MSAESHRPIWKSARRRGYDYAQSAAYLVTVAVDLREWRFGDVDGGIARLNCAGMMIETIWCRIPQRFPGVEIDAFVVMPNHFHGIIFIGTDPISPPPSLTRVMQAFKSETAVEYSRGIRDGIYPKVKRSLWQRSFHDDVLQGERTLELARQYVSDNPRKWQDELDRRELRGS
jgi:REP element-mobilizing transposase RayT